MLSDIEISLLNKTAHIEEIAKKIGINKEEIELYGKYKAKISMEKLHSLQKKAEIEKNCGKLILVTAITPTSAGEGKSTVSIGLTDGLRKIGKNASAALREPSLGPCLGVKGGACGGGYAQIVPMEDINLHFTGDIHAITAANNIISSIIDNHIHQGNELKIDPRTVVWKRCLDINDRCLRNIICGLGSRIDGIPREEHFTITAASEIMAILCLSKSLSEIKQRISEIVIAQTYEKTPVKFGSLKCAGAVTAILKDAVKPNLVQTLEKTPVFVHGGPFANIAHGCSSINASLCAMASSDYVVTEAGFAADLGAEKFMDIKCRIAKINPSAIVITATIRALKMQGSISKTNINKMNIDALKKGFENLKIHIENISKFKVPAVVAINKFNSDTNEEIEVLKELCKNCGVKAINFEGWEKGSDGSKELAQEVVELCAKKTDFHYLYEDDLSLKDKIITIAKEIYRAGSVEFQETAEKKLQEFTSQGYAHLPVCIAKTQNSISHNPKLLGAPSNYVFPIRNVHLYAGAGFVTAFAGDILTMPGLPKIPAAEKIDIDDKGIISGLF